MNLLAQTEVHVPTQFIVFPTLDSLTFLLAAFFFYCLAKPEMVRNRTQYWGVFFGLILIVVLTTLRLMLYNSPGGQIVTGILIGLTQIAAMVLTVLYVGGMSVREMAGEMGSAVDEVRTGGMPKKTPIVPLTGDKPRAREDVEEAPPRYTISLPKKPEDRGGIPLE
ncbi:MAG TPA: hypothetical protein VGB55_07470 [Tepidisphaeraceae bacterium]|jgi:hypothetical protein